MSLMRSIFNGELKRWITRNSVTLAVNLTSSVGLIYLWNNGHKYLIPPISGLCLGSTYLYSCMQSRGTVSSDQAIIVTGCDSGLGYSLALHCRQLGATVIAGVLRDDGPGAKTLQENDIFVYPLDITNKRSVVQFRESIWMLLKENNLFLHSLINNAGVMIFGEFEWQTEEQVRSQVEVNVLGTMRTTRELMPIIRAHSSRIIVISSHCTSEPLPGVAAYGASKAAINAWATALRVELKKYGIKVICFVPGSFTHESNILARQNEHFETMRLAMSKEAKNFYGDYFTRYAQYFVPLSREMTPMNIKNKRVYKLFERALLDKYPSAVYKCEPARYFFYHSLFKIAPTSLRDRLVERFVRLPIWTKGIAHKTSDIYLSSEDNISETPDPKLQSRDPDIITEGSARTENSKQQRNTLVKNKSY